MSQTVHILLTRFNVATQGREAPIRNAPGWLQRRFDLFERYCLPSLEAQTTKNFSWLIYFDSKTPDQFRERIERDRQIFDFEPRFVSLFSVADVVNDLRQLLAKDVDLLLTTRLDNDDAVSRDFIERIHRAGAEAADGTVLNFTNGLAMRSGAIYSARDQSNPFTTLVEREPTAPKTIWSAQHHQLSCKWNIVQVDAPPTWLQVIHGENVTNRVKGRMLSPQVLHQRFSIAPDIEILADHNLRVMIDNFVLYPFRTIRERVFLLLKATLKIIRGRT
ncbi:glycosyltransferase [Aurantiacibacter sp. MUD11]|uniref:glycosyltransferase n=1 Tax=Aurantiacibacter sp. MUD11 TaxID=3003265 RepID=UPI0022AADB0C|nr:glycosyltransferase [Aurantiacibacter sp. MUD11]WAT17036.1 glycosyltransferase [Aurantiacibacter sp. MUD11]